MSNAVKITKSKGGWGGPLVVYPTKERTVVASVTGGTIHPLAKKIAEMLDVEVVDAFNAKVEPDSMIVAVVDCGGTLRCGVYPKMGVKTVDIHPISPSGPLSKFMNEDNFVSGSQIEDLSMVSIDTNDEIIESKSEVEEKPDASNNESANSNNDNKFFGFISSMGRAVGKVVNTFYQAGRDALDIVLKNIVPFMMFVSVIVGIILYSGIGDIIANAIKPLAGSLIGLIGVSVVCALPFLSPVLGPGAVIAQVVGVLLGVEIGKGTIPVTYSLPALFAINSQVGCDFIPVALTMAEAEDDTVSAGVPAMLFSRLITGPVAVGIAFLLSFGMY